MTEEGRLAKLVCGLQREQIPENVVRIVKQMLMAVAGAAVAGASEDGCPQLRAHLVEQGGSPEATVMVYGDKLPAHNAALLNGVMSRALDFCDAMAPGLHIGSSLIPTALAAAELKGGCSGRDFLTALVVGAEVASRMNLSEAEYNGFDPTGVAAEFGATAAAARILELSEAQTLNALALAFNRCGGSFQSNVDASLAVRLIQGWVAEAGLNCAVLAKLGFTGPANFLSGVYGYLHLFGRDRIRAGDLLDGLGERYALKAAMFKRYPSCGLTQGATELALGIARETGVGPEQIATIEIRVPPYAHRLVGGSFFLGQNPRVNAQFSLQFCVANALIRGSAKLSHFHPDELCNPSVLALIERITVISDSGLDVRGHTAVDLTVVTKDKRTFSKGIDIAPGFPGNPLSNDEHRLRFDDCMNYAKLPLPSGQAQQLIEAIEGLDETDDARRLVQLLVVRSR